MLHVSCCTFLLLLNTRTTASAVPKRSLRTNVCRVKNAMKLGISGFGGPGNIRQNHPFGNHLVANPRILLLTPRENFCSTYTLHWEYLGYAPAICQGQTSAKWKTPWDRAFTAAERLVKSGVKFVKNSGRFRALLPEVSGAAKFHQKFHGIFHDNFHARSQEKISRQHFCTPCRDEQSF